MWYLLAPATGFTHGGRHREYPVRRQRRRSGRRDYVYGSGSDCAAGHVLCRRMERQERQFAARCSQRDQWHDSRHAGHRTALRPSQCPARRFQQWNARSAATTRIPDVHGTGTSRTGAPSVPISETFSGTSNWSLGAVSINPTTADIGVTTSVSAVPVGQNSTYNITVTNNGLSAANNVVLTDTYASTGLAVVSVTPSAGTTCVTGATIVCTLPTSFASGATATVAVKVSTTTAGFYPNTATVTDSGTPPDPNTGNNTYVALAPVVSVVCSGTVLAAGGTLSGVVNTYYPGTANVAAGGNVDSRGNCDWGRGHDRDGSLLLVIQMQDASINTTNTVAYGNGSTGTGFTAINNAGNYEFVTATGPIAADRYLSQEQAPAADWSSDILRRQRSDKGAKHLPGCAGAAISHPPLWAQLLPLPWNGIDWRNSGVGYRRTTRSGRSDGFRGWARLPRRRWHAVDRAATGANTDYRQIAPATYTGAAGGAAGVDGRKERALPERRSGSNRVERFFDTLTGLSQRHGRNRWQHGAWSAG